MARLPKFADPGTYVRYVGPSREFPTKKQGESSTKYVRLLDREAPLKYPFRFASVSPGRSGQTQVQAFPDLELPPQNVAQAFLGVSFGGKVLFYHPNDVRLLKWPTEPDDILVQDTANIEHADSPVEDPRFEFWVAPSRNFVPGVAVENVLSHVVPARSIDVNILFVAALFNFEFVEPSVEPDVHEKLVRHQIPSRPISFGGGVKVVS